MAPEASATGMEGKMQKLMDFGGGLAMQVLNGKFDDQQKVEALNFIGLAFNLSEETGALVSMQNKLTNLKSFGRRILRLILQRKAY